MKKLNAAVQRLVDEDPTAGLKLIQRQVRDLSPEWGNFILKFLLTG